MENIAHTQDLTIAQRGAIGGTVGVGILGEL